VKGGSGSNANEQAGRAKISLRKLLARKGSGTYFYKLSLDDKSLTGRLLYLK